MYICLFLLWYEEFRHIHIFLKNNYFQRHLHVMNLRYLTSCIWQISSSYKSLFWTLCKIPREMYNTVRTWDEPAAFLKSLHYTRHFENLRNFQNISLPDTTGSINHSYGSSQWRCSIKKGFHKNFANFTGNLQKETSIQVLSCEICEHQFKNICFEEYLRTTASINRTYIILLSWSYISFHPSAAIHLWPFTEAVVRRCSVKKVFLEIS